MERKIIYSDMLMISYVSPAGGKYKMVKKIKYSDTELFMLMISHVSQLLV